MAEPGSGFESQLDAGTRRAILDLRRQLDERQASIDALQAELDALGAASGTYTPTLTGMAIGTGGLAANTAEYTFLGGRLSVNGTIVFGSAGTTFPTNPTVSLPSGYSFDSSMAGIHFDSCTLIDSGSTYRSGKMMYASATAFSLWAVTDSVAPNAIGGVTTTVPFTWTLNDTIVYSFTVRATGP